MPEDPGFGTGGYRVKAADALMGGDSAFEEVEDLGRPIGTPHPLYGTVVISVFGVPRASP